MEPIVNKFMRAAGLAAADIVRTHTRQCCKNVHTDSWADRPRVHSGFFPVRMTQLCHSTFQHSTEDRSGADRSWEKSATEGAQISGGSTGITIPAVTVP